VELGLISEVASTFELHAKSNCRGALTIVGVNHTNVPFMGIKLRCTCQKTCPLGRAAEKQTVHFSRVCEIQDPETKETVRVRNAMAHLEGGLIPAGIEAEPFWNQYARFLGWTASDGIRHKVSKAARHLIEHRDREVELPRRLAPYQDKDRAVQLATDGTYESLQPSRTCSSVALEHESGEFLMTATTKLESGAITRAKKNQEKISSSHLEVEGHGEIFDTLVEHKVWCAEFIHDDNTTIDKLAKNRLYNPDGQKPKNIKDIWHLGKNFRKYLRKTMYKRVPRTETVIRIAQIKRNVTSLTVAKSILTELRQINKPKTDVEKEQYKLYWDIVGWSNV